MPPPASRMPKWYQSAILLQILAPLSWGFGLWLIFLSAQIGGSGCLTCLSQLGIRIDNTPRAITETAVGSVFVFAGLLFFLSSVGLLASNNGGQAGRWLRWMGRCRPKWSGQSQDSISPEKYRSTAFTTLSLVLFVAILVIPGIGEDRQFPLNQFFNLWGTAWYFYVFAIGVIGLVLIYKRVAGGYFLSFITSLIAIEMVVPDLFGLLPPEPPTTKTSIILATQLPFAFVCIWASLRELQHRYRR